jgi:hypothetical protein
MQLEPREFYVIQSIGLGPVTSLGSSVNLACVFAMTSAATFGPGYYAGFSTSASVGLSSASIVAGASAAHLMESEYLGHPVQRLFEGRPMADGSSHIGHSLSAGISGDVTSLFSLSSPTPAAAFAFIPKASLNGQAFGTTYTRMRSILDGIGELFLFYMLVIPGIPYVPVPGAGEKCGIWQEPLAFEAFYNINYGAVLLECAAPQVVIAMLMPLRVVLVAKVVMVLVLQVKLYFNSIIAPPVTSIPVPAESLDYVSRDNFAYYIRGDEGSQGIPVCVTPSGVLQAMPGGGLTQLTLDATHLYGIAGGGVYRIAHPFVTGTDWEPTGDRVPVPIKVYLYSCL